MSHDSKPLSRLATIVVVDDEPNIMDGLAYLLEHEGYEVHRARNGKAALEQVKTVLPALLITDFMMPVMSGKELAIAMKADPRLANIPIILATGAHLQEASASCELFSVILQKPYRPAKLLETIKLLLEADDA